MRAYMAHGGDPADCAVLVLAPTIRAGKALAWKSILAEVCDRYPDIRIKWLRAADMPTITRDYPAPGVYEPRVCRGCEQWSVTMLNGGACDCGESIP